MSRRSGIRFADKDMRQSATIVRSTPANRQLLLKSFPYPWPFIDQYGENHPVKYASCPRYPGAAKNALLDGPELRHGSARASVQRVHAELYAVGSARKGIAQ